MTNWEFKIRAYLHDPPDKPFALGRGSGHEAWGRELAALLTGGAPPDPGWTDAIKRADHLAAAADRTGFLTPDPVDLAHLRHPISGQEVDLGKLGRVTTEARDQAPVALREELNRIAGAVTGPQDRFLALWGLLLPLLRTRMGDHELGSLWDWLPADTRMPNHPIALHQALVSAIASILVTDDEPALLTFSIGPVQRFIEQARRTSDVAGGSIMLSEALLAGLMPIVDTLGPDHVVFPALRQNALFWLRLKDREGYDSAMPEFINRAGVCADDVDYAGLPNRFLAIVPSRCAADIAAACEAGTRDWWRERISAAASVLARADPVFGGFEAMAHEQLDAFLQVAWAASPWPSAKSVQLGDAACITASGVCGGQLPPANEAFIEAATAAERKGRLHPFKPNGGALYGAAYEAGQTLIDAVKRTRSVPTREEQGLKCSLCGERSVVPADAGLSFEAQRSLWVALRQTDALRPLIRRGEALCGVCWTKRHYAFKVRRISAPSTAELAAAPFKKAVLENMDRVGAEAAALTAAVQHYPPWKDAWTLNDVARRSHASASHKSFGRVAGEAILGYSREDRDGSDDDAASREVMLAIDSAAAKLRRAVKKWLPDVPLPRPYLAAIAMDGDHMGRWLSGTKNGTLQDYLSSVASASVREAGGESVLSLTWPVTPGFHATLSEACGVFSQQTAPRTLHRDGLPGWLVYSGGDDVLALCPVGCPDAKAESETATEIAWRLRMRFSGSVERSANGDRANATSHAGFVIDDGRLGLAFGHLATARVGIAVFHQKWPLGRAIAEARVAEKYAKDVLGRDAMAISISRRSGQITRTGLRFAAPEGRLHPVLAFQRLCHAFAFERLSTRFLSEVGRRFAPFVGGLGDGELMQLATPLAEQALSDHLLDTSAEEGLREALLALVAGSEANETTEAGNSGPPDLAHLCRWLGLIECAAFLGRGGDE